MTKSGKCLAMNDDNYSNLDLAMLMEIQHIWRINRSNAIACEKDRKLIQQKFDSVNSEIAAREKENGNG